MINKIIKKMCVVGILSVSLLLCGCIRDNSSSNNNSINEELTKNSPFELVKQYSFSGKLLEDVYVLRDTNTNIMYWYVVDANIYNNSKAGFSVMYNENGDVMTYSEYIEKGY